MSPAEAEAPPEQPHGVDPATPGEAAVLVDLLRVIVAHVLVGRKGYHLRISKAAQDRYPEGVLVHVVTTTAGDIEAWLEPARPDMRRGVPYVPAVAP